jgi:hypothetical protein
MLLYHGSNVGVCEPRLIDQTRGLDFGSGFYLTSSRSQAERFSEIVCNRNKHDKYSHSPTVSKYEFDMSVAEKQLQILRFHSADADWLRFVVDNRLKRYGEVEYDVVIGAVANDDVMPTIQALLGGFLTEEAALVALKTKKLVDQFCFKSEKALDLLKCVQTYTVEGK